MKLFVLAAGLAACAIALPAAAQTMTATPGDAAPAPPMAPSMAWWNPMGYVHDSYVQLNGGTTFEGRVKRTDTDEGFDPSTYSSHLSDDLFASAVAGHNLTPLIALELEGFYVRDHFDYVTLGGERARREYGGLGNVKLRAPYSAHFQSFAITPYIAGGIGYGDVEYNAPSSRGSADGFIWQGKAGLEIKTGTPVSFDIGYRYLSAPDYETPNSYGGTDRSAQVKSYVQAATLGVRYSF